MLGGTGNDTLSGGTGDDRLEGGSGNDTLKGNDGHDTLIAGNNSPANALTTIMIGGGGNDTISFERGNGAMFGFSLAEGGSGSNSGLGAIGLADTIAYSEMENVTGRNLAGAGDNLSGNSSNNVLSGLAGDDKLDGLAGSDTLLGGAGADILFGGLGNDTLDGGTGLDSFDFTGTNSETTSSGFDTILNFELHSDVVILRDSSVTGSWSAAEAGGDTIFSFFDSVAGKDTVTVTVSGDTGLQAGTDYIIV